MPDTPLTLARTTPGPSAGDQVYEALHRAIITGQFKDGEPLRQEELARQLHTSRIPVREALNRLEQHGLVQIKRYHGYTVAGHSRAEVEELCAKILLTFPDCTTKTIEELRKPKLEAWNRNKEDSRAWLALNMVTEARAGFTAFNAGTKDDREIDFVLLRQKLAAGEGWVGALHDSIQPQRKHG